MSATVPPALTAELRSRLLAYARRARGLAVARALLLGGGALAFGFAVVGLGFAHVDVVSSGLLAAPWVVVVVSVIAAIWSCRGWRRTGDPRAQAQLVEDALPELRGRLLLAIDRDARPQGSSTLAMRASDRALALVMPLRPRDLHPARALVWHLRFGALGLVCFLAAYAAGAVTPGAMFALAGRGGALPAPPATGGPRAVIGDVSLRYLYPTYTRLEPLVVENGNGEVHAPPGTRVEVRARAARVAAGASFVAYGFESTVDLSEDPRALSGKVDVAAPGTWKFVVDGVSSQEFGIVPEPDLPPDVGLSVRAKVVEVEHDAVVPIAWTARDDYGVVAVRVEIREAGATREVELRVLQDAPREAGEGFRVSPAQLGIAAGVKVALRVGAADNDEVSGSKVGWSAPVELEVLGPRGRDARADATRIALRDALLGVLAETVVEPTPAIQVAGLAASWGERAEARYREVDEIVRKAWGGVPPLGFDATVLKLIERRRRSLFSFARAMGEGASDRDLERLAELQRSHLGTLEEGILALDTVVRAAALREVLELVRTVARVAGDLDTTARTSAAPGIVAGLTPVDTSHARLDAQLQALEHGTLRTFVEGRLEGLRSLAREARVSGRAGRVSEARQRLLRLAEESRALVADLEDLQQRGRSDGDKAADAMKKLAEELKALEEAEGRLRQKTSQARARHGPTLDAAIAAWTEVERLARQAVDAARRLPAVHPDSYGRSYADRAAMDEVRDETEGVLDAARARSLSASVERALRARDSVSWLLRRSQRTNDSALATSSQRIDRDLEAALRILSKVEARRDAVSPELQKVLEDISAEQASVAERAAKAERAARTVAEQLPMDAPGLVEGAEQGTRESAAATISLRDGDAVRAEGAERSAQDGFGEALEALKQAMQTMQQMQQAAAGRKGEPQGGGRGDEEQHAGGAEGEDGQTPPEDVLLPAPEAFKTPEAYRKALLEGMRAEVPEEYRALNRRYYEELVRQ